MSATTTRDGTILSAAPTDSEIAAWQELPREEQVGRTREMLASREASTPCDATMPEIWAEIEGRVAPRA